MQNSPSKISRIGAAASRAGRSIVASAVWGRKQLWIWPLAASLALGVLAWIVHHSVERALKDTLAAQLITVRDANAEALGIWARTHRTNAELTASEAPVRKLADELVHLEIKDPSALRDSPDGKELGELLAPTLKAYDYAGFALIDKNQVVLASSSPELVGSRSLPNANEFLEKVFSGKSIVTRPVPSTVVLEDFDGQRRAGVATMFVAAPVQGEDGGIVAALGFRIRPDTDFGRILQIAESGKTGETYAFDAQGVMVSQSRFDDQLKQVGLLADRPELRSQLNLDLRDPGVNMTEGGRPKTRRSELPLTKAVATAIEGKAGFDVDGYRDYRGVPVVGAWLWAPEYGMGLTTEMDLAEALRPIVILRTAIWSLFGLLAVSSLAIFGFTIAVARLQSQVRHAALQVKQLGQYELQDKIGSGGMGTVYRARHAMLRRPTAVKLLDPERTTEEAIRRFEREVQLTCQLSHPNTITIFDYGRTPEGIFYYAMEYLEGIDLESLVQEYGPQPAGRVVHILRQVCGSLAEAHDAGLVHRDIKPANIVLTCRGGETDVVKVLDFGLVKAMDQKRGMTLTAANVFAGTPMYMAPEGFQAPNEVDPRSDIYAVGAVGYFLLTGTPVFSGASIVEVCMKHANEAPEPMGQRMNRPVPSDLEQVLMRCLAKRPADRPANAREVAAALSACAVAQMWLPEAARAWWDHRAPQLRSTQAVVHAATTVDETSVTLAPRRTL